MDLARDEVRKAGGVPFVVELCSEGVLEFVRVEGQCCEPVKVLLVTVGEKEGQNHDYVEVDDQRAEAYARLPREFTRPISFGFKSGIRPTPPAIGCRLAGNEAQCRARLTACLEADIIVVVCDGGCGSEWWQHAPLALESQRVT